jgi:GH18 family chitinase
MPVSAALVLNPGATDWNTNTGNAFGGYVSPTNPDYAYSAYALKNSIYYLKQQTAFASNNMLLSIGGYLLSNFMDGAGANAGLAQTAADQILALVQLCGAKGVDLDYEPVGVPCSPTRMALICQKVYTTLKAADPTLQVHLTLIPPIDLLDPDNKLDTAVACAPFVDQINVMTYDDPSNYLQTPYQPGSVQVYNHTGVGRSTQSVQWFIDAGVPANLLAMGFAGYGRNSASSAAAFANQGAAYDQIVVAADAAGQTTNNFTGGRYSGTVEALNGSGGNFYGPAINALWGFDSVDTITTKAQTASQMGLKGIFMWQIANDYANQGSPLPPGNARANFALIQAAVAAIAPLP